MRFVFLIVLIVMFNGCGVGTDSSKTTPKDSNNSDNNTTIDNGDNNTTDPGGDEDLGEPNADQARSDFDTRSAIKDQNACTINATYKNARENTSFDPTGTVDEINGMTIASLYRYNPDLQKTIVVVYYPDLLANKVGTQINLYENNYRISYDISWGANDNKFIYIRTPRDIDSRYYGCIRYKLSSNKNDVEVQRVYRVNE